MHRACAAYTARGGDEAEIIGRYSRLIDRCARRMSMRIGIPSVYDDLWSAGALGLLDAVRRFDAARDVRLESFAEHRIRGAMLDELRRMDHLPRRLRAQTDKLAKARHKLAQELGHEPTTEELAAHLQMDPTELGEIELLSMPPMPLADGLSTPAEEEGADESIARQQQKAALAESIGKLSERLQLVLSLHYVEGLTYREIAGILGVSEPRVCQLHSEALKKIRGVMPTEEAA